MCGSPWSLDGSRGEANTRRRVMIILDTNIVATRNVRDFGDTGIQVVNPYDF
jgi:hypothetical protein